MASQSMVLMAPNPDVRVTRIGGSLQVEAWERTELEANGDPAELRREEQTITIRGRNLITGLPESIEVSSVEIREALAGPVGLIVEAVRATLDATPPELVADLKVFPQTIKNVRVREKKPLMEVAAVSDAIRSAVLARGADGVLIGGCHFGDCHYAEGNHKALRRVTMLRRVLADMGIEPDRFRLEWISAAEGEKVKTVVNDMTAKMKALGPLGLPQKFNEWDREMEHFAQHVAAKEADIVVGNCLPLLQIPVGTMVHNVELKVDTGTRMTVVLSPWPGFTILTLPFTVP